MSYKNKYGFLLIDKPVELTSFQVISRLRKITGIKKIGHTGTLDPFATGLLPICIGPATRLASFLSSSYKTYQAQIQFQLKTDTGDIYGEVLQKAEPPQLSAEDIAMVESKVKEITSQTPPPYSAVKVNGQRAYKLAREGKKVNLKARTIKIAYFKITQWDNFLLKYEATVSKGTYIRVLSETIAEDLLGTIATTIYLRRIAVDHITIEQAVALDELTKENWQQYLYSPQQILTLPQLVLSRQQEIDFCHGRILDIKIDTREPLMVLSADNTALGIGRKTDNGLLKPDIVLIN